MTISYKKFLPSVMRETRWGDLIIVFQDIVNDLRSEKVDLLKNKFDIDLMTNDELKETAIKFGYNLLSLDGYTSGTIYLQKQIRTLVPRILRKNCRQGYKYIDYIYNLTGDIYPIRLINNQFDVWDEYWDRTSINVVQERTLDEDDSYTLDSTDPDWITALDQSTVSYTLLRHLVIQYTPKFIETEAEFISSNTHRSFWNDVLQMKRATEIPYFEHKLELNAYSSGTLYTQQYTNYDQTITAGINSIFLIDTNPSGLINFDHIQFGNGARSDFSPSSISGVVSELFTLRTQPSGEIEIINATTTTRVNARKIITEKQKIDNPITELCLMGPNSGAIFYSTFPAVKWYSKQYSNICWDVNLI